MNTASRIEALNRRARTSILVSEATYRATRDRFAWKRSYRAEVKGKTGALVVFNPDFGKQQP